ncbi:hypothetical protein B0O99DRAFT_148499 [Bisporella sp. PMI_857]|nr:hypothetical protein B0O99DRAFT_148499 [Bisporella sp. PMI_857]
MNFPQKQACPSPLSVSSRLPKETSYSELPPLFQPYIIPYQASDKMQLTKLLPIFLLVLPALAEAPKQVPPTPEQSARISQELTVLGQALQKELADCIAVPGENTAECLNRQPGLSIPAGKALSDQEVQEATKKYSELVGKALAECTQKKGFYYCLEAIKGADDKKQFNFKRQAPPNWLKGKKRLMVNRGFGSDFVGGFKKGFSGVFNFALGM